MGRIIISEKQFGSIKKIISEEIEPSEAYRDEESIQTIINGKRNVGFLAVYSDETRKLLQKVKDTDLGIISMPQIKSSLGKTTAHIIYRKGHEEQAQQLAGIARKNGGYLPINTPEETYVIGILLGYNKETVKTFVKNKFPTFTFH